MSNEDQETQNQMIHLDTEIKLMKDWLACIAQMTNILLNTDSVLSLLPGSADISPEKGSQSVTQPPADPLGKPVCHAEAVVREFAPSVADCSCCSLKQKSSQQVQRWLVAGIKCCLAACILH